MRVRRVVVGLVLGLITGSIIGASQNPAALRVIGFIEPIGQLWVRAIQMTVVPLVMSLLFIAVAGREESAERMTAVTVRMVVAFAVVLVFAAVLVLLLGPSLMNGMRLSPDAVAALRSSAAKNAATTASKVTGLPGFAAWVTSLVPANPISAAADGAMLPLIVFTLLLALASRAIEPPLRQNLLAFFGALAGATTRIVEWIIAAAPVGIFALVAAAASRAGLSLAGAMLYYVVAISVMLILFALLLYPIASMGGGLPLGAFTRAAAPAQAVALGSSSSLASLPTLIEGGVALGLPPASTGFVLPLAVATFKAATPITWTIGTLFLARLYGVTLGTATLVTLALTAVALSLTIPGVPQGAQLLLAPVLVSYGIPVEGVALLIAADTIPDLVGTMANVTADLVVATVAAPRGRPLAPVEAGEGAPSVVADHAYEDASSADA